MDQTFPQPLGLAGALPAQEEQPAQHVRRLYRALSHNTVKYAYSMPRIEQLLERLRGNRVVSKLDLSDGFHRIRMEPDDIAKTAFVTQFSAFEFTVMPFGLANAPAQFTLMMDNVLRDLPLVCVFMDDILVFSKSIEAPPPC
jgi:Reverse transcriptase (RNA-dependent DNA polymerase)